MATPCTNVRHKPQAVLWWKLLTVSLVLLPLTHGIVIADGSWYAGTWDSTVYNRSEHPKTVALRIELHDTATGEPVAGVTVALKGKYTEERIGTSGEEFGLPYEPQEREFEMKARTGGDGVAVFALTWKKQYPWHMGRANKTDSRGNVVYYDVHTSWNRPVDDIEKVERIETQSPTYRRRVLPFDFKHLTEVGQVHNTESQAQNVFRAFEDAWHSEMRQDGVKFCILDLGSRFPEFQKTDSTRPEFFETIRRKNFGQVFSEPQNFFSFGDYPQSQCGPYFVYVLEVELERAMPQVEIRTQVPATGESGIGTESSQHRTVHRPPAREDRAERSEEQETQPTPTRRNRTYPPDRPTAPPHTVATQGNQEEQRPAEQSSVHQPIQPVQQQPPQRHETDAIGLGVTSLSTDQRRGAGLFPGVQGAWISYVAPGSPADRAGLQAGMVIESIDQRFVGNAADYSSRVRGKKQGDQFDVGVWEKGAKWSRGSKRVSL